MVNLLKLISKKLRALLGMCTYFVIDQHSLHPSSLENTLDQSDEFQKHLCVKYKFGMERKQHPQCSTTTLLFKSY